MTANVTLEQNHLTPDARTVPLPGARSALMLLLAINLFNYIDRQVLAAVEPEIRKDLLSDVPNASFWSGLLPFAFLVTYMLTAPLFGWLADRTSRWLIVGVGVIVWTLASGASGLAWPVSVGLAFWLLLVTRCFVGVGEGAYGPVAPAMIADLYPVQDRGRVLAWFYLAIPVGGALGYTLGDVVLKSGLSWHWAFYLVVPPGLLLGLLCFFMREPPRGQMDAADGTTERRAGLQDYLLLAKIPSYALNTLGMTGMSFAIGGLAYWMPEFLDARHVEPCLGMPPRTFFGALTALSGLLATLMGGIAGDRLRGRFPGSYFLVSGVSMMIGFPMVLLVVWTPFPLAWVFVFLAVFCLFFNTGPTNTILANVTHPAVRASAFALNILFIHLFGDAVSPAVMGLVKDLSSLDDAFILVSAAMLVGGLFWLWGTSYLERDTALAPTRLAPENSNAAGS